METNSVLFARGLDQSLTPDKTIMLENANFTFSLRRTCGPKSVFEFQANYIKGRSRLLFSSNHNAAQTPDRLTRKMAVVCAKLK